MARDGELTHPGRVQAGEAVYLGIPTGIAAAGGSELALARLASLRNDPGRLVGPDGVQTWSLSGSLELEGRIVFVGPWEEGLSLLQVLEGAPAAAGGPPSTAGGLSSAAGGPSADRLESALPHLERLLEALLLLERMGALPPDLQADAIFFLPGDRVLFLPPLLMRRVLDFRPAEYRNRLIHAFHPAGLRGKPRLSFALGAFLYRLAAGVDPFPGGSEEEIQDRMRRERLTPLPLAAPDIRPPVGAAVLRALGRQARTGRPVPSFPGPLPSLPEWLEWVRAWRREGIRREVGPAERERLRREAEEVRRRAGRAFGRGLFWRLRGPRIALIAAAVLVVGGLLGGWLRGVLAPGPTRGLSPAQVVQTYYRSQNELDVETMSRCVTRGAGRQDIDVVTRLLVISRVSQAYEGASTLLPAPEWDRRGRPRPAPPQAVFGILDLRLRPAPAESGDSAAPSKPAFLADYEKWIPAPQEDLEEGTGPAFQGYRILDRLELRFRRGAWVIDRLERLEVTPLEN